MLNGPAQNHHVAIPALPCGFFFAMHGKDFQFFFKHSKGNCEKWCLLTKFEYHVGWFHSARPWEMIWKNIHYIWFSHFTLIQSHWCWKYSLSLYFIKNSFSISLCWPAVWQLKLSLKLLDLKWCSYQYILLQTRSHIMTINQHNISTTRFLPPTNQKCADCWCIDSSSIIG